MPIGSNLAAITADDTSMDGVIAAGYFLSIILPIVGFFTGVYLALKGHVGHGVAAMALSCIASSFWFIVFLKFI